MTANPRDEQEFQELPEGWIETSLGEVVDILDSRRIPINNDERTQRVVGKPEDELFPYYGATGQVGQIDNFIFDEPLILLGEDGVQFFDRQKVKAYQVVGKTWVNNHAHVLRASVGITLNPYVTHYLNVFEYEGFATGTTRLKLTQEAMRRIPFPLPPLPEQIRIADKLDALLSRVEAGRERLERVPGLLKRFRQSVLSAAVSGELTREWRGGGEAEWEEGTLGQVLRVSSGNFLPAKAMATDGHIPVYGGNGVNGFHDKANVFTRTLVIGRVGFYCGSIHMTPGLAWITDNALIARFDSAAYDLDFLFYALKAIDLRENDSSSAQPVISGHKIYSLAFSMPPLPEQIEIVRRVEALFAIADRIEARYTAALTTFGRLTPALLAKAFRGELVPQDPNDEPASVLLQRIRAARAAAGEKPGRGRGAAKNAGETSSPAPASTAPDAAAPKRRGRPPRAQAQATDIAQASSYADAVRQLEAQKAARAAGQPQEAQAERGTRQGELFGNPEGHS